MKRMNHEAWLDALLSDTSRRTAASRIGSSPSLLSQQLKRGQLSAEVVIRLCKTFGHPVADGLVETGYCSPEDFEFAGIGEALAHATNQQITDEITRRLDRGEGGHFTEDATVPSPPGPTAATEDDLAARREGKAGAKNETPDTPASYDGMSDDELIDRINAGQERIVAQKRTPPLEEEWT